MKLTATVWAVTLLAPGVAGTCKGSWLKEGKGAGTRYWDCCKPHCSGEGGDCFHGGYCQGTVSEPAKACYRNGTRALTSQHLQMGNSACAGTCKGDDCLYTCMDHSQVPEAINETHAYALVVAPLYLGLAPETWNTCPTNFGDWVKQECNGNAAAIDVSKPGHCLDQNKMRPGGRCCSCYEFTLDGNSMDGHNARAGLKGKKLIVQATNIGYDVSGEGHFDIMIPGGGFGLFSACPDMSGIENKEKKMMSGVDFQTWGARAGGLLSECGWVMDSMGKDPFTGFAPKHRLRKCQHSKLHKNGTWADPDCEKYQGLVKSCLRKRCEYLFGGAAGPKHQAMLDGCLWHADWLEAADNPTFSWKEVTCPKDLVKKSGCRRCDNKPGTSLDKDTSSCKCTGKGADSEQCAKRNLYCAASQQNIDPTKVESGFCTWSGGSCKSAQKPAPKWKPDHCSWGPSYCKVCSGKWCPKKTEPALPALKKCPHAEKTTRRRRRRRSAMMV